MPSRYNFRLKVSGIHIDIGDDILVTKLSPNWSDLQHIPSLVTAPLQQTWVLLLNQEKWSFSLLQHRPGPEA